MKKFLIIFSLIFINISAVTFSQNISKKLNNYRITNKEINFKHHIETYNLDNSLNVIIEIPSGSIEKWEVNESGEAIELGIKKDNFSFIEYLGYPANYGFLPKTLLPTRDGVNGEAVDAIVLGPQLRTGQIVRCNVIGMLNINNQNLIDSKVICIDKSSDLNKYNSIKDLQSMSPGILKIIEIWFKNYQVEFVEILNYSKKNDAFKFIKKAQELYSKEIKNK